jgi:hypothetical protein
MSGVQAHAKALVIDVCEQLVNFIEELNIRARMLMENSTQFVLGGNIADPSNPIQVTNAISRCHSVRGLFAPGGRHSKFRWLIDQYQESATELTHHPTRALRNIEYLLFAGIVVNGLKHEGSSGREPSRFQLRTEDIWILRQVPHRTQLEGVHTTGLDLIEHPLPRWVLRVVSEIHAPRGG